MTDDRLISTSELCERDYYKRRADRLEAELDSLAATARLAERFARAKGRHHSQHAMCDLLEHFGLPFVRPGEEPNK